MKVNVAEDRHREAVDPTEESKVGSVAEERKRE